MINRKTASVVFLFGLATVIQRSSPNLIPQLGDDFPQHIHGGKAPSWTIVQLPLESGVRFHFRSRLAHERLRSVEVKAEGMHDIVNDNAAASADTGNTVNEHAVLLV
jgi:hypothetical protein